MKSNDKIFEFLKKLSVVPFLRNDGLWLVRAKATMRINTFGDGYVVEFPMLSEQAKQFTSFETFTSWFESFKGFKK